MSHQFTPPANGDWLYSHSCSLSRWGSSHSTSDEARSLLSQLTLNVQQNWLNPLTNYYYRSVIFGTSSAAVISGDLKLIKHFGNVSVSTLSFTYNIWERCQMLKSVKGHNSFLSIILYLHLWPLLRFIRNVGNNFTFFGRIVRTILSISFSIFDPCLN